MTNELATILCKLHRDAEELAEEMEQKRIQMKKEEERKRMVLEAGLEEKCREQDHRHEIQMQSMMFNYLQQLQSMHYPAAHNHLFMYFLLLQRPFCLLVMTCPLTYHLAVPLMTLINFMHTNNTTINTSNDNN